MAYGSFVEVSGRAIAEREYSVASEIKSTEVTSCIIVASPVGGGQLFAIHLSIFGLEDAFGTAEANEVERIMRSKGADMNRVHLYGEIGFWHSDIPGYNRLMTVLNNPSDSRKHQKSGNITVSYDMVS